MFSHPRNGGGRAPRSSTPTAGRRGLAAGLALLVAAAAPVPEAAAQAAEELTLEGIHASGDYEARGFSGTWLPDGESWAVTRPVDGEGSSLVRVAADDGAEDTLIAAHELRRPVGGDPLEIESFAFSADGRKVLLFTDAEQVWRARTRGTYWVFDLASRRLIPVGRRPGGQMFAKLSPDGGRVAFVRDHDLWLTDLATGEERRLTTDGSEAIINGTTDWVYEEELGLRDAFRWSSDGRRIAYWQLDQSPIRDFHLVDETRLYPELVPVRYPKAGTPNSAVRVGSLDLETGMTTWFELDEDDAYYVARMEWAGPGEVLIQTLNRHQNRLELRLGDAATGATTSLLVEEDEAWVDVNDDFAWVRDGRSFLWTSERDGWNHLYLYRRDGSLERRLTGGAWDVTGVLGVDRERERVYVSAAYGGPPGRSVLAVDLGGDVEPALHGERGSYGASFSPDFRRVVYTWSTIERPPVITLAENRDGDVRDIRVLEDNADLVGRLEAAGLAAPEFLTVEAADGTPLRAWMIKPADFDPERSYGLLLYVYGGPGSQTVRDAWGGSRYVWHQYLARRGLLVASVDNRGTGARGRDFKKQTYLRLGQLETADQIAAASRLGALPWVDASRVGIWGWSYGGYMTLMATLRAEGAIAAGVSVAPVTDWRLYDTIYTERFMRTPQENPSGYETGAPLAHAAKLEVPLLIIHGTADDNVHPQNTIQMIDALEREGRQFDMRLYPNERHGISGGETRLHLFEYITDFLERHLNPGGPGAAAATDAG